MKKASAILVTNTLALMPALAVHAEGWAAPANKPTNAPESLDTVLLNATNWLLGMVGVISVLVLIWGGVQYVTAAGNEDQVRGAKSTIKTAIMGLVVAGIAYALVNVIITTVLTGGSGTGTTTTTGAM